MRNFSNLIRACVYFILGFFFGYLFYVRFWKWRECIHDSLSSCVTPEGENLIAGGQFWAVPAVLFILAGIGRFVRCTCLKH